MTKITLALSIILYSAITYANNTYSMIRAARTSQPIKVFSGPSKPEVTGKIELAEFSAWGSLPVLEEQGTYIRFSAPTGQEFWILGEKVEIARSIECGRPTPESVVLTVKDSTLAARGIGEACGNKEK